MEIKYTVTLYLTFLVESIFKMEPNVEVMLALICSMWERISLPYMDSTQRLLGRRLGSGGSWQTTGRRLGSGGNYWGCDIKCMHEAFLNLKLSSFCFSLE